MQQYKIGIVGPYTGPRSCYGELLKQVALASSYSKYFEYIFADDGADPHISFSVAQNLVSIGIDGVIGHLSSASAEFAIPLYQDKNIPLVLPAATATHLTQSSNVYRICPTSLQQAQLILTEIKRNKNKPVYLWHDNTIYARSIIQYLNHQKLKTFDIINKIEKNAVIIFIGSHFEIAAILNKIKTSFEITVICCDDCSIKEFEILTQNTENIKKYVISPQPNYEGCISDALALLYKILSKKDDHLLHIEQENINSRFKLLHLPN